MHAFSLVTFTLYIMQYSPAAHGGRPLPMAHGEEHLASRYRTMLRPGTFSKIGTLPATLATCQYWETFLDEAPCHSTTFGKLPELVGTLPKVPHLTLPGLEWTKT